MKEQIKPQRLRAGARIGIVNPAYWLDDQRLQRAMGLLTEQGYELVAGKSKKRPYLSQL